MTSAPPSHQAKRGLVSIIPQQHTVLHFADHKVTRGTRESSFLQHPLEEQGRRCKQEDEGYAKQKSMYLSYVPCHVFCRLAVIETEKQQIKHAAAARFSSEICKD
jgi:hypothetical protein